ncbi:MAG: glycosyltransferase family 39 protein [Bacteroidales bacterium]|nr:glycosyltransferase family 39 protein [Bacteroidales bacterium]
MKNNLYFIILLFISAIALLINAGSYGVVESSDARYAEIAREMYVSGDYLNPDLLDVHHYHKPPFTYQITTLGYKLFGINAFGARFFLQIAVLIQLILVYAITLLLFNKKQTALWAAMIYLSFPIVLSSSRNLTTDAFLATFVLLSLYAWVKYRKGGVVRYLYLFTFSLGLGFLTKGPVVFIVLLVFIIFYNRVEKSKSNFGIHHIFSWLFFLAIISSWFVYLVVQNPEFVDYFLGRQTVDRFSKNVFDRTEPFWYFFAYAPLMGVPWLLIFPFLIKQNRELFSVKSVCFVLLMAIMIPLVFFSISSSKRILYILPLYSLLAVLIAQLFAEIPLEKVKALSRIILGYALLIVSAFIATLFINTELFFPKIAGVISIFMIPMVLWLYNTQRIDLKLKSVYLSSIVSLFLLIGSSYIMSSNQLEVNSTKPITDFIINNQLRDRYILEYNTKKLSIQFALTKSLISLNDGNIG